MRLENSMRTGFAVRRALAAATSIACCLSPTAEADLARWIVGDPEDAIVDHRPGLVLAGGGGDCDPAMRWMLERAAGGDVVVLRTSGGDGYNPYLFEELGVEVDSVETLRVASRDAANDPEVVETVRRAEVLFIAGGDQRTYVDLWRDTALFAAIDHLLLEKQATVGGTSAGMMILAGAWYAPETLGVLSEEALGDPHHPYMTELGHGGLLQAPHLERVIADTHFDDRNRRGRLVAFLARLRSDLALDARGLACNEWTAIAVDEHGLGRVFGEWPAFPDHAHFLSSPCPPPRGMPERCEPGLPLDWNLGGQAVHAVRISGTPDGRHAFDLDAWTPTGDPLRMRWWVEDGVWREAVGGLDPACPCLGDLDASGDVGGGDLAVVLAAWNTPDAAADLDGDGLVGGGDLAVLLASWGACGDRPASRGS